MKKIMLLFTIFCSSALNSMEPIKSKPNNQLEIETIYQINDYINLTIKTYNDIASVIEAIKADSDTIPHFTAIINSQKGFTQLVHTLSYVFTISPSEVAYFFATNTAKKYIDLGNALIDAIKHDDIDTALNLIKQGADINYYDSTGFNYDSKIPQYRFRITYAKGTPLTYAVIYRRLQMVQLLLNAGAQPKSNSYYDRNGYFPSKYKTATGFTGSAQDKAKIRELIDQTRKNNIYM